MKATKISYWYRGHQYALFADGTNGLICRKFPDGHLDRVLAPLTLEAVVPTR